MQTKQTEELWLWHSEGEWIDTSMSSDLTNKLLPALGVWHRFGLKREKNRDQPDLLGEKKGILISRCYFAALLGLRGLHLQLVFGAKRGRIRRTLTQASFSQRSDYSLRPSPARWQMKTALKWNTTDPTQRQCLQQVYRESKMVMHTSAVQKGRQRKKSPSKVREHTGTRAGSLSLKWGGLGLTDADIKDTLATYFKTKERWIYKAGWFYDDFYWKGTLGLGRCLLAQES